MRTEKAVICCIASGAALNRITAVCEAEGWRVIAGTQLIPSTLSHVVAMIHDLECSDAVDTICGFRRSYPGRPVLLYCRPTAIAAEIVSRLSRVSGIATWVQTRDSKNEHVLLATLLRHLISQIPDFSIRTLFTFIRPRAPVCVVAFVDALLDRLEDGRSGAPHVSEIAWRCGFGPWVVRRACQSALLPAPDRLIRWVTLIYTIALAESEQLSLARAALKIGLNDKHIRNLRSSLIPQVSRLAGSGAHDALAHTVMRFATLCGLAYEEANAAVSKMLA